MKHRRCFYAGLLMIFLAAFYGCTLNSNKENPYVVLVSLDAFRWDYASMYNTPVLDDIAEKGVSAGRLIPSFPTKTFPNHYSIITGLYPDHHGLINNSFYAPDLDLFYRIGDRAMVENAAFYGGEPIWTTAQNAGLITASFYWVGSEAPIHGRHPDYWKTFDDEVPFGDRVDTVLKWLSLPEARRPHFITLYFEEPDAVSHDYGPVSPETAEVVMRLDSLVGVLRNGISKLPQASKVNLIVLSDHGMTETSEERYNYILDTLPRAMINDIYGGSPVWLIDPVKDKTDSVLMCLNMQKGMKAYRKDALPEYLHYGSHPRIPEIVLVADPGWTVGVRPELLGYTNGDHGYDTRCSDMHSIFYAEGPAFRKGFVADTLYNVDIYNIVTKVLRLSPALNDGDEERILPLFR